MLEFVRQAKPCGCEPPEQLVHTAGIPWLVASVRKDGDYEGLTESAAVVQALDVYDTDPWQTLAKCGLLDPEHVEQVRQACVYDGLHVAFYPTALCSAEAPLPLCAATRFSPRELAHHNESAAVALSLGRHPVTRAAQRALGTGYCTNFRAGQGVSLLALMEMALSNGSRLLGWGWLWAPRG